jgi:uncharacterized membrane-anchored protein YitT (DUF2179 family)
MLALDKLVPMPAPMTRQPFLELVYAVLFPAVGSAMLFNVGGSTGGTDIVAMILKKHTDLHIGNALLWSDTVITLGSFLFGAEAGLFAVLALVLKSTVVDYIIENINLCKCFTIITTHRDEICEHINRKNNRGATVVDVVGSFTHAHKIYDHRGDEPGAGGRSCAVSSA